MTEAKTDSGADDLAKTSVESGAEATTESAADPGTDTASSAASPEMPEAASDTPSDTAAASPPDATDQATDQTTEQTSEPTSEQKAPVAAKSDDNGAVAQKPRPPRPKPVAKELPEVNIADDDGKALHTRTKELVDASSVDEGKLKLLRRDIDEWLAREDLAAGDRDAISNALGIATALRHQQLEKRDRLIKILGESMDGLEKAVTEGNLKDAQSLEQKVTSRLAGIDGLSDARRAEFSERLAAMTPEIRKLHEWRSYGTDQARRKIIDEMTALQETKLSPPQIASEIRRARETWQSWDKSGDKPGKGLWEKFDAACTKAYEPCKEFYEKQNAERANNLAGREKLCERLEKLHESTDWDQPEWRDIDKAVNAVRNDWRKAGHIDRKQRKAIDKRYDAALAKVGEPLDRERDLCMKRRQKLIADVQALAEVEDLRTATDAVKTAQTAWKPTVLAPHRVERKLWREFKTACDAVYDRRKASFKERDAGFSAVKAARVAVVQQIEELGASEDGDARSVQSQLAKLRGEYDNAGELGRKDRPGVEKRFRAALKTVEKRIGAAKQAKAREQAAYRDNLAELCDRAEQGLADSATDAASIQNDWDAITKSDDAISAALTSRFDKAIAALGDPGARATLEKSFEENQREREAICLELEVRAEIDSPAEFADARMQLQVNRLAAAMGKGKKDSNRIQDTRELLESWLTTGPASANEQGRLQQRFERARAALKGER